jgi:hypothetical protein
MPDFLPSLQLPQGMAEALIRLKSEAGAPWAQLAQGLGQTAGGTAQVLGQQQQQRAAIGRQSLTPEQINALMTQATGSNMASRGSGQASVQIGQNPINRQTFPNGVQPQGQELLQKVLAAREATARAMGVQGLKNEGTAEKDHTEATDEMLKNYPKIKQMGFEAGDMVPNRFLQDQEKPASASAQNQLTPEEDAALVKASLREKDPIPNSLIKSRGAGAKILAQSLLKDPNYTPQKSEIDLAAGKAGTSAAAKLESAGPPQVLARYANSTKEVLKVLQQQSAEYPRFGEQFLNAPYNKLKEQSSPEALKFKQSIADVRGHIAAVLAKGYAPQREQIEEAQRYIPDTITPKQLTEDIPFLNKLIDIQVRGMMTAVKPGDSASKDPSSMTDAELAEAAKKWKPK